MPPHPPTMWALPNEVCYRCSILTEFTTPTELATKSTCNPPLHVLSHCDPLSQIDELYTPESAHCAQLQSPPQHIQCVARHSRGHLMALWLCPYLPELHSHPGPVSLHDGKARHDSPSMRSGTARLSSRVMGSTSCISTQ